MQFSQNDTALVVIDPQNDVLSETGVSWALVGASVKENNTVENLATFCGCEGAGLSSLHLTALPLSFRPSVAVWWGSRENDVG